MINRSKLQLVIGPVLSSLVLTGCVWKSDFDKLQAQNVQLQQQTDAQSAEIAANKTQIARLQGAIKYTVNSDLLFPSGGWELSAQGKTIIAKMASQLASTQQNKIVVNGYTDDTPVGPGLAQQGVTTNQQLSEKRADSVMRYLISQGLKPDLLSARGFGAANPVASNNSASGRAQNRRVELTLAGAAG